MGRRSDDARWRGSAVIRRIAPFHETLGPHWISVTRGDELLSLHPVGGGAMEARPAPDATEGRLRGIVGGSTYEVLLPSEAVEALGLGPYRPPRTNANGVPEGWERRPDDGPTLETRLRVQADAGRIWLPIALALLVLVGTIVTLVRGR